MDQATAVATRPTPATGALDGWQTIGRLEVNLRLPRGTLRRMAGAGLIRIMTIPGSWPRARQDEVLAALERLATGDSTGGGTPSAA